jgi:hypothetical protein
MPVIEDHPPFGLGIMPDHAGDRGVVLSVLAPPDHLHIKHDRALSAECGSYKYSGHVRYPDVDIHDGWRGEDVISRQ